MSGREVQTGRQLKAESQEAVATVASIFCLCLANKLRCGSWFHWIESKWISNSVSQKKGRASDFFLTENNGLVWFVSLRNNCGKK